MGGSHDVMGKEVVLPKNLRGQMKFSSGRNQNSIIPGFRATQAYELLEDSGQNTPKNRLSSRFFMPRSPLQ
jgi:hypothetical protein